MFKEYKMEYLKEKKKTPTQLMIKQILIELDSSWKKYHEMKEKTGKENMKELAILILEKEIKYLDLIVNEIDEKLKNIHEEAKLRLKEGKREACRQLVKYGLNFIADTLINPFRPTKINVFDFLSCT